MDSIVGRVVMSKAGRDKGKFFVVHSVIDEKNVLLVDGKLRKLNKLKKKKLKHLQITTHVFSEFEQLDLSQPKNNSVINKFIKSILK